MSLRVEFEVAKDLACFAGHFPGNPLVPGALLLAWAEQLFADPLLEINGIKQAKFSAPVRPGQKLVFNYEIKSDKQAVSFAIISCAHQNVVAAGSFSCVQLAEKAHE